MDETDGINYRFPVTSHILLVFKKQKTKVEQERYFELTEKLYTITIFSTDAIHIKGIWHLTHDTNPIWIKHVALWGNASHSHFTCRLLFVQENREKPDNRFYMNLAKATLLTLILVLLSLIILIFDLSFFEFEERSE